MSAIKARTSSEAKRLAYRLDPRTIGEQGISLVAVMVVMMSVVLVGVAIMTLGTAETDIVQMGVEDTQAFYAAEAGIERTQKVLDQLAKYGSDAQPRAVTKGGKTKTKPGVQGEGIYPDDLEFENVRIGEGLYNVTVTKTSTSDPWDTTYEVVSTGDVNGVTRELRATMAVDAFSKFLFYANETKKEIVGGDMEEWEGWEGWEEWEDWEEGGGWENGGNGQQDDDPDLWYTDDGDTLELYDADVFDGRVHLNDKLKIRGDPFFGGKVTTWAEDADIRHGSMPVFARGLKTGSDYIPMPDEKELKKTMAQIANQGGLCLQKIPKGVKDLNGTKIEHRTYDVVLGRNGVLGTLSYRIGDRNKLNEGDGSSVTEWTDVSLSSIGNGVVWFKDKIRIAGKLRGQVTIGSEKDIYIVGDVLYASSTPGEGPDPGCQDLLGLIGKKVKLSKTLANGVDVEIHAAIMCMKDGMEAEKVKDFGDRGDLIIHGAVVVGKTSKINEMKKDGFRGYHRKYYFDPRLTTMAPPFFPRTRDVSIYKWRENPVSEEQ